MDETYIKLENSYELRKDILRLALDAAKLLKSNMESRNLREEKIKKIEEVNSKIKDINSSVHLLKSKLPKIEKSVQEKKAAQKIQQQPKIAVKQGKELSDLEKLGTELKIIEQKISRL